MKIGILQTGHSPGAIEASLGTYSELFETLLANQGFTFQTWKVVEMEFPTHVTDADGWLVTGSKHGAYEDHDFIPPLETFIRDAYAANVPQVGICFGHQIIAQALGGKVEKFKNGWAVGRQTYDMNGQNVSLNAWHQDQVIERPADATVIASNEFCENAGLAYGKRALTLQPHPEFGPEFIAGLIQYRGDMVEPDRLAAARDTLNAPTANAEMAAKIASFFKAAQSDPAL